MDNKDPTIDKKSLFLEHYPYLKEYVNNYYSQINENGDLQLNSKWVVWYHDIQLHKGFELFSLSHVDTVLKQSFNTNSMMSGSDLEKQVKVEWDNLNDAEKEKWNWHVDSYIKVYTIATIQDFHSFFEIIPSMMDGMWFIMRENVLPLWEDSVNVNGGAWRFRIYKDDVDNIWKKATQYLIGETMCEESTNITGISISPKNQFATLRFWSSTLDNMTVDRFIHTQGFLNFKDGVFAPHKEKINTIFKVIIFL